MPATREWTVMFYLASDNPLAPGTVPHLKAMKSAGYHPEVNVIAQFDPNTVNIPVHIFDVNRMEKLGNPNKVNIGFGVNDSLVRNLLADKLWSDSVNTEMKELLKDTLSFKSYVPPAVMGRDRDPKESLRDFLTFCQTRYPARHYMLFLIGHGLAVGDDLFLFDEHGATINGNSGPRSLLLKDLGAILTEFEENLGSEGELELIGFHSCSMSGAEVAFELQGKANYMLASQGTSYLHSWPYRQILIRLFNDLGSPLFSDDDLKTPDLFDEMITPDYPTWDYIREVVNGNGGANLLSQHVPGKAPNPTLIKSVVKAFSSVLSEPELFQAAEFQEIKQSAELQPLIVNHETKRINGQYLRWMNRRMLLDGLPPTVKETSTKINIKKLLISIFHHCLYNSYDFQLAGYSSDLTLCDLNKVHELEQPVVDLVKTLRESLQAANDPLLADLLVLAHWDAQSFYEERYTDLYDFCLRLQVRCLQAERTTNTNINLKAISDDCSKVMKVLKRGLGLPGEEDGIIVRCEFCGAASQYSHGLSVFFPWSRPIGNVFWDEQYSSFRFAETGWTEFLNAYFDGTMRKPQHVEEEENEDPFPAYSLPKEVDKKRLALLDQINSDVFPGAAQLKSKSKDSLAGSKSGSQDPTGSDCQCGSIKNYPPLSNAGFEERQHFSRPVANLYTSYPRFLRALKPE